VRASDGGPSSNSISRRLVVRSTSFPFLIEVFDSYPESIGVIRLWLRDRQRKWAVARPTLAVLIMAPQLAKVPRCFPGRALMTERGPRAGESCSGHPRAPSFTAKPALPCWAPVFPIMQLHYYS
jgi:hypothetical protein